MKHTTFIAACREFFGFLPSQTLQQFAQEIKQLTVEDKAELISLLLTVGYDASQTT